MHKTQQLVFCILVFNLFAPNSCSILDFLSSIFHLKSEPDLSGASCLARSTISTMPTCSVPSDDLPSGKYVAGTISRKDGLLPKWINLTLARQGQEFAREFKANLGISHIFGLISGGGKPDLINVLAFTQSTNTIDRAIMRYTSTITQVLLWYDNILKVDADDNVILTSLENVRAMHIGAARKSASQLASRGTLISPGLCENSTLDTVMWEDFEKDLQASNISLTSRDWPASYNTINRKGVALPVNQFAHALTQFAFVGFPILYPERLHIDADDEDLFAFNHLWAVLGYALGIDDEYNIALQPDMKHLRDYYQRIMDDYWLPGLFTPNNDQCSKYLIDALLNAFEKMIPILSPRLLLMSLLRDILKIESSNIDANFSLEDKLKKIAFDIDHIPMVQNHKSRVVACTMITELMKQLGKKHYGAYYKTEQSKAENVFYSV